MNRRPTAAFALITAALGTIATPAPAVARPAAAGHCTSAAYRQFDFWLGSWTVTDGETGALDSHVKVTRVQNGCGVREQYFGASGASGESLSMYDPQHRVWTQTWVSGSGEVVRLTGALSNGAMSLTGELSGAEAPTRVRGIWSKTPEGVREVGEKSSDGQAWRPWFDLRFRRTPGAR